MAAKEAQRERGDTLERDFCRSIDVDIRVLDETERTIEVIASSEALDSHGDVIKQHWDFTRYEKNPVVLWNHNKFGTSSWAEGTVRPEDLMPIGQALEWKVVGKKLIMKVKLASAEYSAIAQKVFLGCKERVIRAVSVGFRAGNVNAIKDKAGHTIRWELGSPEFPNILHELSFVPIGSNPDAVAKSIESDRKRLDALATKDEHPTARGAKESIVNEEQLKAAHAAEIKATTERAEKAERAVAEAKAAADAAAEKVKAAEERAEKAEGDLKAEKAASEKLETELKAAREREDKLKDASIAAMVKGYVGSKLAPTEEDEYVKLAKEIGAERAENLIKGRPDLAVTKPATAGGQPIKSSAPGTLETANPAEALLKAAKAKASKAA